MRYYTAAQKQYVLTVQKHRREFGDVGLDKIRAPDIPETLLLYFELKRWPGALLWDGGLQDQPAWTWELIDLAGVIFEDSVAPKPQIGGEERDA